MTEENHDKRLRELAVIGPGFDPRDLPNACTAPQRSVLNSSESQVRDRRGGGWAQRYSVEFGPGHLLS